MSNDTLNATPTLDQQNSSQPTRKVDFTLRALTAVEMTVTADVPLDADDEQLFKIASQLYSNCDGSEFVDDGVTFDEGTHDWSENEGAQSSILEFTFKLDPMGCAAHGCFFELVADMSYFLHHRLIERTEVRSTHADKRQICVVAFLHHSVTETEAQEISSSLAFEFLEVGNDEELAAELLDVSFPSWC
ncbi:hypothetical protein [Halomonas sp. I5-271120]|uniref:hypothetical protein n=1 Tax=Halomonas sp. I5-271120 TaxID=3061632 RepID=UPI0027153589|nr:hypothetical protein [Halomonas sp. I5-271120]